MVESSPAGRMRAIRGIEAAAWVLSHTVHSFGVANGEGAARLAAAIERVGGPASRLRGEGVAAAREVLGAAAAGRRTALIASGDGLVDCLPELREMSRLGLPVVIVVASHGPDVGLGVAHGAMSDIAHVANLGAGLFVAGDPTQVGDHVLAGQRAAFDRGAPWIVAFDLARVGLALCPAKLPEVDVMHAWVASRSAPADRVGDAPVITPAAVDLTSRLRDIERFGFAASAACRDLERIVRHPVSPMITAGLTDAEVVVVASGPSGVAARAGFASIRSATGRAVGAIQLCELRPLPVTELVRLSWRAGVVLVHEPWPESLGAGGRLSDAIRAAFADALTWHPSYTGIGRIPTVVTVHGESLDARDWLDVVKTAVAQADPPRAIAASAGSTSGEGGLRVRVVVDEVSRESALQLVVDWMARAGASVTAHAYEPDRTDLVMSAPQDARGGAPADVLLICPSGRFDAAQLEALPRGALVALAGDFPDRVMADTIRLCAARGVRVAHVHVGRETERPGVAALAMLGVVRALVLDGAGHAQTLHDALVDAGASDAATVAAAVNEAAAALRGQAG